MLGFTVTAHVLMEVSGPEGTRWVTGNIVARATLEDVLGLGIAQMPPRPSPNVYDAPAVLAAHDASDRVLDPEFFGEQLAAAFTDEDTAPQVWLDPGDVPTAARRALLSARTALLDGGTLADAREAAGAELPEGLSAVMGAAAHAAGLARRPVTLVLRTPAGPVHLPFTPPERGPDDAPVPPAPPAPEPQPEPEPEGEPESEPEPEPEPEPQPEPEPEPVSVPEIVVTPPPDESPVPEIVVTPPEEDVRAAEELGRAALHLAPDTVWDAEKYAELAELQEQAVATGQDPADPAVVALLHLGRLGAFSDATRLLDSEGNHQGRNYGSTRTPGGLEPLRMYTVRPGPHGNTTELKFAPWAGHGGPPPYFVHTDTGTDDATGAHVLCLPGGTVSLSDAELFALLAADPNCAGPT